MTFEEARQQIIAKQEEHIACVSVRIAASMATTPEHFAEILPEIESDVRTGLDESMGPEEKRFLAGDFSDILKRMGE